MPYITCRTGNTNIAFKIDSIVNNLFTAEELVLDASYARELIEFLKSLIDISGTYNSLLNVPITRLNDIDEAFYVLEEYVHVVDYCDYPEKAIALMFFLSEFCSSRRIIKNENEIKKGNYVVIDLG